MKILALMLLLPIMAFAIEPDNPSIYVVQPFYMKDVYSGLLLKDIESTIITLKNPLVFDNAESEAEAIKQIAVSTALLGTTKGGLRSRRKISKVFSFDPNFRVRGSIMFSVFPDPSCYCYVLDGAKVPSPVNDVFKTILTHIESSNIYIVNDSITETSGYEVGLNFDPTGYDVEKFSVLSEQELRSTILSLQLKPEGILVINTFHLFDDYGRPVSIVDAIATASSYNKKHIDISLFRPHHDSTLAIGFHPDDISRAIIAYATNRTVPEIKPRISVNVRRANEINRPDIVRLVPEAFMDDTDQELHSHGAYK